jgi:hypothetical protein
MRSAGTTAASSARSRSDTAIASAAPRATARYTVASSTRFRSSFRSFGRNIPIGSKT